MKVQKKVSVGAFAKKGEDYQDGDIITIADEGRQVEGTFGVQSVFLVKLPSGEEKNMTFNQTSVNNLVDAYGDESSEWVGRKAKIWLILQSVSGKMLKVVYLTHPDARMVESNNGIQWEIGGEVPKVVGLKNLRSQLEAKGAIKTASGSPKKAPPSVGKGYEYPKEESNPDEIPFD